jgi:hypothetical protein
MREYTRGCPEPAWMVTSTYVAAAGRTLPAYLYSLSRVDESASYAADDRTPLTPVPWELAIEAAARLRSRKSPRTRPVVSGSCAGSVGMIR